MSDASDCAGYQARHFAFAASPDGKVATITLDRPERKNPLTFDSYAELREVVEARERRGEALAQRCADVPLVPSMPKLALRARIMPRCGSGCACSRAA